MTNLEKFGAQIWRGEEQESRGRPPKSKSQLVQATINGTPGGTMVAFDRAAVEEPRVVGSSFLLEPPCRPVLNRSVGR